MSTAAEYDALARQIEELNQQRKQMLHAEFARHTGANIGDRVREVGRRKQRHGILRAWSYSHWPNSSRDRPWIKVALLKRDGTPGEREAMFFEWVKDASEEAQAA